MLRYVGLVCAVLASLAHVTWADDSLVKEMELEIRIQELSKEVYESAKKAAGDAVKKTSLWNRWRAAREALRPKSQQCRRALEARREYGWEVHKQKGISARTYLLTYSDPKKQELDGEVNTQCREHLMWVRSKEYGPLVQASRALYKEVRALRKKFTKAVYVREMRRRLIELELEVTREAEQKIETSYKRWAA